MHEIFGRVDQKYIDNVEQYNKRKFENVGKFDFDRLNEFVNFLDCETSGDIELLIMPHSTLPDGHKASLFVVKSGNEYFALAGLRYFTIGDAKC